MGNAVNNVLLPALHDAERGAAFAMNRHRRQELFNQRLERGGSLRELDPSTRIDNFIHMWGTARDTMEDNISVMRAGVVMRWQMRQALQFFGFQIGDPPEDNDPHPFLGRGGDWVAGSR